MKYEVLPFNSNYEIEWEEFVSNHKEATIFHSIGWKKVIQQTFGFKPEYLIVRDTNNNIVGISPAFNVNTFFGKVIVSQPFFEYGAPIIDTQFSEAHEDILNIYKNICDNEAIKYVEMKVHSNSYSFSFDKAGYIKHIKAYDYYIDIKGKNFEKDIWLGLFNNKVRNSIRKGIKIGLKIEQREDIDIYYDLYLKTMARLGSPPHPKTLFENIKKYAKSSVRFTFAYLGEVPIAGLLTFLYNNRVSIVGNVSCLDYQMYNANDLLYNEQIEYATKYRFDIIDLGRTRPNSDYERYKSKWGATRIDMVSYIYPPSAGEDANPYKYYDLFSGLTKKVPWIMSKIGQYIVKRFP